MGRVALRLRRAAGLRARGGGGAGAAHGGRADGAEAEPAIAGPSWAGPAALRRAFVVHFGEGRTIAYLDRATWRDADRVVIPVTGVAFDFFNRDARWLLREQDVRLVAPDAAGQVQA